MKSRFNPAQAAGRTRGYCGARSAWLTVLILGGLAFNASAAEIHSAHVDRDGERIIVRGSAFGGGTAFTLGGVAVLTDNVTPTELDIPFAAAVYTAVQWAASYNLVADASSTLSVYIDAPIVAPPPPPPPPPPPGGTECPCLAGWDALSLSTETASCFDITDGTQESVIGISIYSSWTIATAFDPNDIFFDAGNPGNSISYCLFHDGANYTVAEPVVNWDQFWSCYEYLWVKVCL